jgi:hypothetical protein
MAEATVSFIVSLAFLLASRQLLRASVAANCLHAVEAVCTLL